MSEVNRLEWDAYIRDSELMASVNRIERRVGGMVDNVTKKGRDMDTVFARMAQAATAFFTISAAENFVQKLIQVRSEFQQLDIAFTTMLGSKERADKLTQDLIEFASTTPFGMKDTANAAKQLLAYGSAADEVKKELRMLGDVASGTSQPIGELVYLYGTLRTQGRAQQMDINQFAGRGIPIYKELAKVLNINVSQVRDFVSAGKVGFTEVQKAFQNMTAEGSMFGGLMEAQSKTIQGELERLGDAYDQMFNKIGAQTEGTISQVIQGASVIVENYETVLNIIGGLIVTYGAYRAALIATAAMQQISAARAVGMTAAEMLHLGAITAKTAAIKVLNAVMLASPVVAATAGILALSSAIYALSQVTDATSASQERLNEVREVGTQKADEERRSVLQLIDVIKDNTASAEEKKAAYDKLQAQTNGILNSFSLEEIAIGKASAALDQYIKNIGRAASARKAFDEFNALAEQLDTINRKGIDGVGIWERTGRALQNAFGVNGGDAAKSFWGFGDKTGDQFITGQQKDVIKKQMDDLQKEFGNEFRSFITGVQNTTKNETPSNLFTERLKDPIKNFEALLKSVSNKSEVDSLKKSLTEKLESLAPNDKQIAGLRSKIAQVAKLEEQYSVGKGRSTTSIENQEFQTAERYLNILEQISSARQNMLTSQLSRDEQEIASTKAKYDSLRDEIRKFNADPRNSTKIDGKVVDGIEQSDISNIKQRQANDKKLAQYEKDYQNYLRYEELKLSAGQNYADDQLGNYKSYLSKLQGEINALQGKQQEGVLSPIDEAYLKKLQENLNAENDRVVKSKQDAYMQMLQLSATSETKIHDIRSKYSKAFEELEAHKTNITLEEYEKRKEALKKGLTEEVSGILLPDLQKSGDWINVFEKTSELAKEKISQSSKSLKADLEKMLNAGKMSAEQYNDIINQIKDVDIQLSVSERGFARLKAILKELKEAEKGSLNHDSARQGLGGEISKYSQGIAQVGNELNNIFDQMGIGSEKFKEDMALTMNLVSDAGALAASIASGDVVGMVVNGIKTISSAIALFTKDRKIERQIKEYQKQLDQLGKTYDELAKKMGYSDTDYYSNADAQLKILKERETALIKMRDAERSKKKSDSEKIKAYEQEILDTKNQQLELEQSIRQMRLQTDINSLAQSVTDALVGAFEAGEDGIDAMDKAFDKFIKNSLANSVRLKFIQELIDDMLKDVDDYMAKNGDSIAGYDFNKWETRKNDAKNLANDFLDAAYEGLGLEKESSNNSSTISGKIKTELTEKTGGELLGIWRAGYDIWKQQLVAIQAQSATNVNILAIANEKLIALNAIQVNTANTVQRLDVAVKHLDTIVKNTSKTGRSAEGMGL